MEFVCAFYNPDFIIWSSLASFYFPMLVMIFLYARIFKVSRSQLPKRVKRMYRYVNKSKGRLRDPAW